MRKKSVVIATTLTIVLLGSIPELPAEGQKTLASTLNVRP